MKKRVIVLLLIIIIILIATAIIFFCKNNKEVESNNGNGLTMTSSNSNSTDTRYSGWTQETNDGNISNAILDNSTVTVKPYEVGTPTNVTNTTKNSNENNKDFVANVIENQHQTVINNNFSKEEEIFIQVNQSTLSNNSATVIIQNNNKNMIQYTDDYVIEKKENDVWVKLQEKNAESINTAVKKANNEIIEIRINWKNRYGDLESGAYRIVKNINNILFFAEFCI